MQPLWKTAWHCTVSYNPGIDAAETHAYDHQEASRAFPVALCGQPELRRAQMPHELENLQMVYGMPVLWSTLPP